VITSFFKPGIVKEDTFEYWFGSKQGLNLQGKIDEDTNLILTSEFMNLEDGVIKEAIEKKLPIINMLWLHLSIYSYWLPLDWFTAKESKEEVKETEIFMNPVLTFRDDD